MGNILIYTDPFKGTIIPTLGLAERLKVKGHSVRYIGVADAMVEVAKAGFDVNVVFEDEIPLNSIHHAGRINKKIIGFIVRPKD
jgi:UDP:flavonoid glycosyltransferase YjiC (YdhE family)